jgi:hypothetical protein
MPLRHEIIIAITLIFHYYAIMPLMAISILIDDIDAIFDAIIDAITPLLINIFIDIDY